MKVVERRFADRGTSSFIRSLFVLRYSLYAFYKLVDDRLRENSLSHHG